jgi:hypothetical protein
MDIRKACRHYYNNTGAASGAVHGDSANNRLQRWGRRDGAPNFTRHGRDAFRMREFIVPGERLERKERAAQVAGGFAPEATPVTRMPEPGDL